MAKNVKKSNLIVSLDNNKEGIVFRVSGNIGEANWFSMTFDTLKVRSNSNTLNPHVLVCKGGAELMMTDADLEHVLSEYLRYVKK